MRVLVSWLMACVVYLTIIATSVVYAADDQRSEQNMVLPMPVQYINLTTFARGGELYTKSLAARGDTLYAIINNDLYRSDNAGDSWVDEPSINTDGISFDTRSLQLVTISNNGTVLVVGRRYQGSVPRIAVWRRAMDEQVFRRTDIDDAGVSIPASISVGKSGIYFTRYLSRIVHRSQDDGLTWARYEFSAQQFEHLHCVWADPYHENVYVSGGDDPTGLRGGVYRSGDFRNWVKVFSEEPGLRIVPVTGNARKRFLGVEAANGGALESYDDKEWRATFGRTTGQYMNFDSLVYTPQGLLLAGFYNYGSPGDKRYGQSGEVWLSMDDGASWQVINTPYRLVSGFAVTDTYIYVGFGYAGGGQMTGHSPAIMRLPNPGTYGGLVPEIKVVKVLANSIAGQGGGFLHPGEATRSANMSPYTWIGVTIGARQPGQLIIEAQAYDAAGTREDPERWIEVADVRFTTAGTQQVDLDGIRSKYRLYRVKNAGPASIELSFVWLYGMK